MKPVALFLVKNGIGYGHIRRALLIAADLASRAELRPIVVSQARTLDLLRTARVPVLNLPLLHRVPSAVGEDAYLDVLDRVVARLAPAVAVEDTYPDARYGGLPALDGVPRMLILRRLDGESFDTLRSRGAFARYDRILLAEDETDVAGEDHSGESVAALQHSDRVLSVGNIHHTPTPEEITTERRRHGRPLVVVNGGAGGDQLHDGYGNRLLHACHRTAARLYDAGHPAQFVVVTGPYYAGPPLPLLPNLTIHRFTPTLPALLAAADVAVIKPGNNALAEALHGSAHLVLVPDASFLEATDGHAQRIVERYGGTVIEPHLDQVEMAIRAALARDSPRQHRPPHPRLAIASAADAITAATASVVPTVARRAACLLVRHSDPATESLSEYQAPQLLSTATGPRTAATLLADAPPAHRSPQEVVDAGTRLLIAPGSLPPAVARWLRLAPPRPALLTADATTLTVGPHDHRDRVLHRLVRTLDHRSTLAAVVLDVRQLDVGQALPLVAELTQWLGRQPITLSNPDQLLADAATRLLHGDLP